MFADTALVRVVAGRGGNGAVSFRHEKFVDKGGPDGGDGGRGGNVVFVADDNTNTLADFRVMQQVKADDGQAGSKRNMNGRSGQDIVVKVPVGTLVMRDGEVVADLVKAGEPVVVAHGGDGGFGNAHFKSSTRQAPRVAELGEDGEAFEAQLELKLLADVGLVGLPNAGKSTFLSVVSNARPEIGDYEFTTLTPNLGVADVDGTGMLIADIPGLIEGASEGKGLGDAFLRHIERTAVILHLVDAYQDDPAAAYKTIRGELEKYSQSIADLPEVIALTKTEGFDPELLQMQLDSLAQVAKQPAQIFAISSQAHDGLLPVMRALLQQVEQTRHVEEVEDVEKADGMPVISLSQEQIDAGWEIKTKKKRFVVTGAKIEKFARRTDIDSYHGLERLRDIMRKFGITHALIRQGATGSSVIEIAGKKFTLTEQ